FAAVGGRVSEEPVVKHDGSRHGVRRANPGNIAFDLDAVGARRTALGVGKILGIYLCDVAGFILVKAGTFDHIGIFESDGVAREQTEILFRWIFAEVVAFYEQFARKRKLASSGLRIMRITRGTA